MPISANVLKNDRLSIKTNKGALVIPITYLDIDINEGTNFSVGIGNDTFQPYNNPVSVVAVKSTPFRATEFVDINNKLQGKVLNADANQYQILYSTEPTHTETDRLTSNDVLIANANMFIGKNGVPAMCGSLLRTFSASSIDADTFKIPSSYGFGEATRKNKSVAGQYIVGYNELERGKIILSISDYVPPDPYNNGGNTTVGGGKGTFGGGNTIFGGISDSIDVPPLPTASASSAGFITLFNPSLAQLNNLANYMWSDLFSLDTFKKIFADPMDCILGLSIVPVKPASAGTSVVKIGNVSTDVSMNKTSSQYVAVDCGTIDVKEYWGAYLDYAPYTQCEIYLPYVGTKQISVDDVMNKTVHVVYHVDILSGACNAYVKCGDSVLYTFVGQCSSSIPISGNDWTNVLNGAISVAGKIGLAMATGGATALMSGIGAASSIISSSKPTVERSGAMSSTGGLLGIQKPYLILTRPKQALPENQNKYTGYPSFITMSLSECSGYTEIDSIHLENMSCTDEEAQEIENLLKSGVIF